MRKITTGGTRGSFGGYTLATVADMDGDAHDRQIAALMTERGLTRLVKSDGCFYPIVDAVAADHHTRYVVLDPYTNYRTTCEVIAADDGWCFDDGWRFHVVTNRQSPDDVAQRIVG